MPLNTVIFDIDGVLIDSEPLWEEAGNETFARYGIKLSDEQYSSTTGLRSREWIEWWFDHFHIDKGLAKDAESSMVMSGIEKIRDRAAVMPGVENIFQFFAKKKFNIGLATSSPTALIDIVIEKLRIGKYLKAFSSAEDLPHGKPHPQVYLNCAEKLNASPLNCLCFEDSYNGMIAAKAARMKCVVVPAAKQLHHAYWNAADCKINTFHAFDEKLLEKLQ